MLNENDRTRILQMLKDGKITVEEAEKLLTALEPGENTPPEAIAMKDSRGRKSSKLRIIVDSVSKDKEQAKVNVSIPLNIVKLLGPIAIKSIPREAKDEMERQGIDIVTILQSIDELTAAGTDEDIVNVDTDSGDDKAKVRIYVD